MTQPGEPMATGDGPSSEPDWRKMAEFSLRQMERQARAIIETVNLIRAQLGIPEDLQIRPVRRPRARPGRPY